MPLREDDETVTFTNVRVVDRRPLEKRDSSVICLFDNGDERPVPRSQVWPGFAFPGDADSDVPPEEPFDLEISAYIVEKWQNEVPPEPVKIPGCAIVGYSDKYGPAWQVRLPNGETKFVKTRALHPDSPVAREGDRGELWVAPWAARHLTGQEAKPKARSHVGQDARAGMGKGPAAGSAATGADAAGSRGATGTKRTGTSGQTTETSEDDGFDGMF